MTTLATLRARIGLTSDDAADDALLRRLIAWCQQLAEARCNRKFARVEGDTYEFNAGEAVIVLPRYPVEEITAFAVRASSTDAWSPVTDPAHHLDAAIGLVDFPGSPLGTQRQRARITFTGGYVMPGSDVEEGQTGLPEALQAACIEQCVRWFRDRDRLGLTSVAGEGSVAIPGGLVLLPDVLQTLEAFRRYTV